MADDIVFCSINGTLVDAPDDGAYDIVVAVAHGTSSDVGEIAARPERWSSSMDEGDCGRGPGPRRAPDPLTPKQRREIIAGRHRWLAE